MDETLPSLILRLAGERRGRVALRRKEGGRYVDLSWETVEEQIRLFGRGLLALGIRTGDRVALMSPNRPEWVFADLGAMACGALSVPVYHTEGVGTLLHIVGDSQSRLLFLSSAVVGEDLVPHLEEIPHLERVVLLEGVVDHPRFLTLEAFLGQAATVPEGDLQARLAGSKAAEVATLVYTSGTTGPPKGVMLSHRNFLSNIEACLRLFAIGEEDECLSFLPLSHVFERMAGYYLMLIQGATIAYAENFDTVPANLREVRPTVAVSVPRLYEKMFARVMERVLSSSWAKKQIFFTALRLCRSLVRREQVGETPGRLHAAAAAMARKTVFHPLHQPLGGRLRFFVSGGAPLGREVGEFFMAVGLPVFEGYGLTETSPVIAVNHPGAHRLGTVGRPIPGTEVRIAEDGEILARGPGVFQGYWRQPEATRQAFTDDWFHTGDIGGLDPDGFLVITDRKKDLIVTAGGENISPQNLENLFKSDKYLANAMVYGDRKPYLTALLVPNFDSLEKYAHRQGIDFLNHCDLVGHPRILELVRRRIDHLQADLPPIQKIKRFTLISRDFAEEEITPTMKVRRAVVREHFHQVLEGMYAARDQGRHDSGFCVVNED